MKLDLTHQSFSQALVSSITILVIVYGIGPASQGIGTKTELMNNITGSTIMYRGLNNFASSYPIFGYIIMVLIALYNGLYIARISIRNVGYVRNTHISMVLYILLISAIPISANSLSSYITASLIILSLEGLLSIKKHQNCTNILFLSSFFVGIAGLMLLPALVMIAPIFGCLIVLNRYHIKEIAAIIVGLIFPACLYSYFNWMINGDITIYIKELINSIKEEFSPLSIEFIMQMDIGDIISISILTAVLIYILVISIISKEKLRLKLRNSYKIFWVWLIANTITILLFTNIATKLAPLFMIPVSMIIAYLFNNEKKKLITHLVLGLVAVLALINIVI